MPEKSPTRFSWSSILWALVFPQPSQRILPTLSGTILIALSLGIGSAAYNSANNILFITLSLMLACLILSGVLSWLNFRGISWRLDLAPPLRAGHDASVALALRNQKNFLPSYGLRFDLAARAVNEGPAAVAESTITGRGIDVRAALAQLDAAEARGQVFLRERLDARDESRLEWSFKPTRRGRLAVELVGMGSLFPFGFLRKTLNVGSRHEIVVWPAAVPYTWSPSANAQRATGGEHVPRAGSGGDLLGLRKYASGDSHRLVHWKASARSRQLLVRQFTAESAEGFSIWLQTDAATWTRPEQFELAVSLCATIAEDLFRLERLTKIAINGEPATPVRRVRELEDFLDRLAVVRVSEMATLGNQPFPGGGRKNLLVFAPDGARGVTALVDGRPAATA